MAVHPGEAILDGGDQLLPGLRVRVIQPINNGRVLAEDIPYPPLYGWIGTAMAQAQGREWIIEFDGSVRVVVPLRNLRLLFLEEETVGLGELELVD